MDDNMTKEYASALFDLSMENGKIDKIRTELNTASETVSHNDLFKKLLTHPAIAEETKRSIVKKVYDGMDPLILHFLFVTVDNGRIADIESINKQFEAIYNEYNKVQHVTAVTTVLLDEGQKANLVNKLMIKYRHKIEIENKIDKSLFGGMQLLINNEIHDFSVKSQLESLKSHILKQI